MSDYTCPCAQLDDRFDDMRNQVERARADLEELSFFEREVDQRIAHAAAAKDKGSGYQVKESSELHGLRVHSDPPRLLTEFDLRETDHFLPRSKRSRHRSCHP